jgi:Domain of unknown function (DUF4145)
MPERCGHCGFAGDLDEVARPVVRAQRSMTDLYGEIETRTYWFLYRCGRCGKATLEEDRWCDEFSDPEEDTAVQLFPASQDNSAIPDAVKRPYWEANRIKGDAPGLYAVGMRKTIEAICKDKGARGSLKRMLDRLGEEGRLPAPLVEMGHQLRERGNLGAHAEDVEVSVEDVPVIEEFVEAVLEYIYRAPAKIAAAQASLEARKASAAG